MGEHTQDSGGVLQSASVVFISDNVLQAAGLEHLLTAAKDLVYADASARWTPCSPRAGPCLGWP